MTKSRLEADVVEHGVKVRQLLELQTRQSQHDEKILEDKLLEELDLSLERKISTLVEEEVGELDLISLGHRIKGFIEKEKVEFIDMGILLEKDDFGFPEYSDAISFISESGEINTLYHEFVFVEYLVSLLKSSGVSALIEVKRGLNSVSAYKSEAQSDDQAFGSIAVKLVFEGKTACLRRFINKIHIGRVPIEFSELIVIRGDLPEMGFMKTEHGNLLPLSKSLFSRFSVTLELKLW